jgi:hypothetical protein
MRVMFFFRLHSSLRQSSSTHLDIFSSTLINCIS